MRPIVGACLLVLALAGCGGSGGSDDDDGADPRPTDDPCSLLSVEDASRIVGVTYAKQSELEQGELGSLCSYAQAVDEAPFALTVSSDASSIDQVVTGLGYVGEVTEEPIDVPGADEALVVSTNDGNISIEQVVAESEGNVYVVTFGGSSTVAAQLAAAVIGEDVPDHAGDPVPDACGVDPAAVESALDAPAEPTSLGHEPAWSACDWETGIGASFTLTIARDAGDLERYVVEHSYVPSGVEPEEITVDGADTALVVVDPSLSIGQATALATVDAVVYEVELTDARDDRAADRVVAVLAASIGSS